MCPDRELRHSADAPQGPGTAASGASGGVARTGSGRPDRAGRAAPRADRFGILEGGGRTASAAGRSGIRLPLAIASVSAWLLYIAIYAVLFALSGYSPPVAIRGALGNGIPDGLLALAVFATSRRRDRRDAAAPRVLRVHAMWALVLVGAAFATKSLLFWLDAALLRGEGSFRFVAGVVAWQIFISALVYIAVAAISQAWLTARRLREEEANTARAEALRARAEMAALRAQLNPHFLFNTLHSVLGMVRRDPALAEAALQNLGDLLHYAIRVHRDGVDWTALRHEWEFTETYLALETIRLGERLRVTRLVDEAALEQAVPTFSLQPLVENAVRHGIAPRAEGGRITVMSRLEEDTLRLEVSNEGPARGNLPEADEGGLGLRVLRDRLVVLYGGRARMTAGPTNDGGYNVVLSLPLAAGGAEAGE